LVVPPGREIPRWNSRDEIGLGNTYHFPEMMLNLITRFAAALCGTVLISASALRAQFPKYKVDRKTMTVLAKHERLGDVRLYKWAGVLPDTVTDTLRFFTRNGVGYMNENEMNRMRCSELVTALAVGRDTLGLEVTHEDMDEWRDSLELIYRDLSYARLDLLGDSTMLFDSVRTTTYSPVPLKSLMEREHWYLFNLWSQGGSHIPNHFWLVSFYLAKDGQVEHWVNSKKTYPAYGGSIKNL
jgi:hypothetical protein